MAIQYQCAEILYIQVTPNILSRLSLFAYVCICSNNEEKAMNLKGSRKRSVMGGVGGKAMNLKGSRIRSVMEGVGGRKWRGKWCNYILIYLSYIFT